MIRKLTFVLLIGLFLSTSSNASVFGLTDEQRRVFDSGARYVNVEHEDCTIGTGVTITRLTPGLVYIMGDSISNGARSELTSAIGQGAWTVHIDAVDGRALTSATVSDIEADAAKLEQLEIATAIVIQLGSNNLSGGMGSLIDTATEELRYINPSANIYWVDVGSNADGTGSDGEPVSLNVDETTPEAYSQNNRDIYAGSGTGVTYDIISWFGTVFGDNADPTAITADLVDSSNLLGVDELHPTSAGEQALANTINDAVTGGDGSQTQSPAAGSILWPADLDPEWIRIWTEVANEKRIDPKLLAGIFTAEHGGKFYPVSGDGGSTTNGGWRQPSSSSATGPFQILDGTYDGLAAQDDRLPPRTDRGSTDPRNNPYTASLAAAQYIQNVEGVPGLPAGSGDQPQGFKPSRSEEPYTAASVGIRYNQGGAWHDGREVAGVNHAFAYADQVADTYRLLGGQDATDSGISGNCISSIGSGNFARLGDMIYYSQRDSQWGDYGRGTIAACGCGPTSMAMIIATLTNNTSVTPQTIADFSAANDHQSPAPSCGSNWSLFEASASSYGLTTTNIGTDYTAARTGLRNGGLIVASVSAGDFTSGGHILVIRAVTSSGGFLVADPNDSDPGDGDYQRKSTTEWSEAVLTPQVRNMFLIEGN